MTISRAVLRASTAALPLAMALSATPAAAQSTLPPADVAEAQASPAAEQDPTEVVVTGSRIRRDPLSQDAPIVFVDQEDIAKTGLNSINDVLQRLPSSGGGLNTRFNNSGNFGNPPDGGGVGAGSAEIDLRYLGSRRTLVLVDGLRFVNGASASGEPGSVDLNAIPESMIERVEVLQDGASAIYGSDAIAGVVNIITKRRQSGFDASAQLGIYDEGDGATQNYQLSWGNGDGPTQIVVGANFVKQDPISSGSRDISLFPEPFADACTGTCSSGTPLGRFIVFPSIDPREDLTLIAPVIGRAPTIADFRAFSSPADRFNFAPFNLILTPLKRYGAFANVRQEITPDINLTVKGLFNRRESRNQAAPLPLFVGPDAGNGNLLDTIVIDATNPFNPFGVTLDSSNFAFIGRRVVEGGPRRYNQKVNTAYGTATLDGKFDLFGRNWFWDVNGFVGRNKARQTVLGNLNAARLQQALGPLANCTGSCVPFNIFGGAGSITPEMLDFVSFVQRDRSKQKLWGVTANLSGSLLELPGGPLGLAIGVEHRDLRGSFDPDETVAAGLGSDIPAQPTSGGYNIDEAYAELNAPLLSGRPGFELLELNGAVRFSDYSTSGSTTTFSAGINWEPIEDLLFRGSWAEGFRAPSIGELFGTPSRFDQDLVDPCSAVGGQIPAAVRANCIAAGVPANGSYVQANPQLPVVTGGNPDLDPETSESWGAGVVWRPSFLPRLSLEANYFDIKVDGAIQSIDAGTLLNRCASTGDALSCAAVSRTASGAISQIRGFLQNIASIETNGLDVNLNYRSPPTGAGTFGLFWVNTFLFDYVVTVPATDGVTVIHREGTEQGSPDQAFPRFKSTAILDWSLREFGASLTGRYISGVDESDGNRMGSRLYTDIQLRWTLDDNFGFAIGANNLFNLDPPSCFTCGLNNMDPTTYDVPGTFFYARVNVRM